MFLKGVCKIVPHLFVAKKLIAPVLSRDIQIGARMAAEVTKKFLNTSERIVDDSIKGLLVTYRSLQVLPDCGRVVLRSDLDQSGNDIVSLVAGGGSGHEPFAAGFVGKGFLTAAVCGDVFTSPPSAHVTAALEAVGNERGTVVFVISYTGDRLNFGIAIERYNQSQLAGNTAFMVVIGDDVALEGRGQENVGRRGLAGALLIMKIAGAMAEQGLPSDKIAVMAQKANECVGTLGVSLSACSIPGKGPMFTLDSNEMELGLGIHGEPGCERTALLNAKAVVDILLTRIEQSEKKCLIKNCKLAVLLNNLGGTSQIEMNVIAGEICSWLQLHQYTLSRLFCGTLMTSLDGHGISITVLKIADDDWLDFLDAPTDAPAWTFRKCEVNYACDVVSVVAKKRIEETEIESGITLSQEQGKIFSQCLKNACSTIMKAEEMLDNLDRQSGDGDCGHTLARGATRVLCALKDGKISCIYPKNAFKKISMIFEEEVGGTTGALYALMFSAAAGAFKETRLPAAWFVALKKGLEAVIQYGEARPGYRTMVDPLFAAVNAINSDKYTKEDWLGLVEAAEKEAAATAAMKARCGRASYTAEATQTEPDPGAIATAIWLRAVYETAFN